MKEPLIRHIILKDHDPDQVTYKGNLDAIPFIEKTAYNLLKAELSEEKRHHEIEKSRSDARGQTALSLTEENERLKQELERFVAMDDARVDLLLKRLEKIESIEARTQKLVEENRELKEKLDAKF